MIIDGITLLLLVAGCVCFYIAGYKNGREKEKEINLNDLKARNDREMEYNLTRHTAL